MTAEKKMDNRDEKNHGDGLVNGGLEAINNYNPTPQQRAKDEAANLKKNDGALQKKQDEDNKKKGKMKKILVGAVTGALLMAGGCGYNLYQKNLAQSEKDILAKSKTQLEQTYSTKLQSEAQKSKSLAEKAVRAEKEAKENREKISNLEKMLKGQKDTLSVVDMSFCKSDVEYMVEYKLGKNPSEHYVIMRSKKNGNITAYNVTLCGAGILFNKAVLSSILGEEKSKKILQEFSDGNLNLKLEKYVIVEKDLKGALKSFKEISQDQKKVSYDYFKKYE